MKKMRYGKMPRHEIKVLFSLSDEKRKKRGDLAFVVKIGVFT